METSVNLLYTCVIFIVAVTCLSKNNTTEGYDEPNSHGNAKNTANSGDLVRECETPNYDSGICVDIRQCEKLLNQLPNKEAWNFVRASTCESPSISNFYPRVCCGKYDNYKNMTKNVDDAVSRKCRYQGVSGGRVVGGQQARLGDFPWMALLLHKNANGDSILGCAGFLINLQYIVTAAHCTHPDSIATRGRITSILLGEHSIDTAEDCVDNVCVKNTQTYKAASIFTHPDYDPNSTGRYNDIAVIKLKKAARETKYVKPICLLEEEGEIPVNYYVSGWGRTENASYSKIKKYVQLPPFNKFDCAEKYTPYRIYLKDSQICAGGKELEDSCTGDSGGPLMLSINNETWYAAGVVSFGAGCGTKGMPGVYTNIVKFIPWIKSKIIED